LAGFLEVAKLERLRARTQIKSVKRRFGIGFPPIRRKIVAQE
jgi:hypothetical protein